MIISGQVTVLGDTERPNVLYVMYGGTVPSDLAEIVTFVLDLFKRYGLVQGGNLRRHLPDSGPDDMDSSRRGATADPRQRRKTEDFAFMHIRALYESTENTVDLTPFYIASRRSQAKGKRARSRRLLGTS
jgi:hypothetical protein